MAKWAVVVSAEQFELERLYAADTLTPPQPASLRTGAKSQFTGSGETLPTGGADAQVTGGGEAEVTGSGEAQVTGARGLATGDEALLVAATPDPVVFGLARVDATGALRYTLNLL